MFNYIHMCSVCMFLGAVLAPLLQLGRCDSSHTYIYKYIHNAGTAPVTRTVLRQHW